MAEGWKSHARLIAAGLALVALVALGLALIAGGGGGAQPGPASSSAGNASALDERFAALSSAESNRCDLGAAELRQMRDKMRLRGSCCFPMDEARYEQQLRDLGRYRGSRIVPEDPYDIPVAMAKRLLAYRDIALDKREQAAYQRATELSELGGPCCCPCWRWQAFKGQASFLLARREWSARQVAKLWDAEEGCGGPRDDHA